MKKRQLVREILKLAEDEDRFYRHDEPVERR